MAIKEKRGYSIRQQKVFITVVKKKSFEAIVREFPRHKLQEYETNITQGLAEIKKAWQSGDGSAMDLTFNDGKICLVKSQVTNHPMQMKTTNPQVTRDLLRPYFN